MKEPSVSSQTQSLKLVVAAFVCIVFMFGVPTMMMPVIYSPLIDEFGWSRAQVTLIATMKFGAGAVLGIVFGVVIDRMSIRKIVLFCGVLSGLAMLAFLTIYSLISYYLVGLALGLGSVGIMIAMKVFVSRAFGRHQGLAVGTALLGTSVAGTLTPVLTDSLIEVMGWRNAVATMSAGIWFIALPAFLTIVRNEPEEEKSKTEDGTETLTNLLMNHSFWLLGIAVLLIGFVDQAIVQHLVLYIDKDLGFGRSTAAWVKSLVFLVSVFGKLGFGWFYDRFSVRGVFVCYLLMAMSVLIAIPIQGVILLGIFAVVRGLAHGGAIVDIPVLAKHCFGPKLLGRSIGLLTACVTLGFAAGPPIVGYIYDTQGSYHTAFVILSIMSLIAGIAVLSASPAYWEKYLRPERVNYTQ